MCVWIAPTLAWGFRKKMWGRRRKRCGLHEEELVDTQIKQHRLGTHDVCVLYRSGHMVLCDSELKALGQMAHWALCCMSLCYTKKRTRLRFSSNGCPFPCVACNVCQDLIRGQAVLGLDQHARRPPAPTNRIKYLRAGPFDFLNRPPNFRKFWRSGLIRQLWTVEAAQLPSTLCCHVGMLFARQGWRYAPAGVVQGYQHSAWYVVLDDVLVTSSIYWFIK